MGSELLLVVSLGRITGLLLFEMVISQPWHYSSFLYPHLDNHAAVCVLLDFPSLEKPN